MLLIASSEYQHGVTGVFKNARLGFALAREFSAGGQASRDPGGDQMPRLRGHQAS